MNKKSLPLAAAVGAVFVASATLSVTTSANPFTATELAAGYNLKAQAETPPEEGKKEEGKGKEGKCGEGKKKEGKCGEGKKDEGKKKEGKCGEGKCGM